MKPWLSPTEAAAVLGVCKQTVIQWGKDGKLEASKIGYRTIRISAASIERLMEQNKQGE